MTDNDTRRYEMFLRVRRLGMDEAASLASNSFVGELFNKLGQLITELDSHASAQSSGLNSARQSTRSKGVARDELERDLNAISRTARSMSSSVPGLEQKFRPARGLKDQELLTAARVFAADTLPLKAEFLKRGLAANFLEDLDDDINAFEAALTQGAQGRETHVNATATIDDLIERGMNTVRELDPIMHNIFEDKPGKLAAWMSASGVERAPRRATTPTPPPTP
jgi:hypothetical protein